MIPAIMVSGDRVRTQANKVLVGAAAIPVRLTLRSLGPQDDDLRVDIDGVPVSDTHYLVSHYYEDVFVGQNSQWQTEGFRKIVLTHGLTRGARVKVWLCDVGGSASGSPIAVRIDWSDGSASQFAAGQSIQQFDPAVAGWPVGTLNPDLNFPRPWQGAGSPPVYVPLAEFTLS